MLGVLLSDGSIKGGPPASRRAQICGRVLLPPSCTNNARASILDLILSLSLSTVDVVTAKPLVTNSIVAMIAFPVGLGQASN